ncbi:MAG: hypothetical protein RL150_509 [Candidatus Parcubacteria bacterium]|jgi:ABC-type polysaccharide/polyol phosphate transport system ATPase subunit
MNTRTESLRIEHLSKSFIRVRRSSMRLIYLAVGIVKRYQQPTEKTLTDITFSAVAGENIGIIGGNGAGKSTLLKCIAGIYTPDSGTVEAHGTTLYLSGFTQGLHNELTMRENIFLIGALMGLTKTEIAERFNEIVELSGMETYLDTITNNFSAGMLGRLSFSIGICCLDQTQPDILLLDEIGLGGGGADIAFRDASKKRVETFLRSGATVLLVSHDLHAIESYCDRVLWLKDGRVHMEGAPQVVCAAYKEAMQ